MERQGVKIAWTKRQTAYRKSAESLPRQLYVGLAFKILKYPVGLCVNLALSNYDNTIGNGEKAIQLKNFAPVVVNQWTNQGSLLVQNAGTNKRSKRQRCTTKEEGYPCVCNAVLKLMKVQALLVSVVFVYPLHASGG
jgi:hypothetical protein